MPQDAKFFEMISFRVISEIHFDGREKVVEACVKVRIGEKTHYVVAEGDGPINALDIALRKALLPHFPILGKVKLTDYWVHVVNGEEATAAAVEILVFTSGGDVTKGHSTNIIEASLEALVKGYKLAIQKSL